MSQRRRHLIFKGKDFLRVPGTRGHVRARAGSDEVREGRIRSRGFVESDWSGQVDAGDNLVQIINTRGRTGWGKGNSGRKVTL